MIKVRNMINNNGNSIANQFEISTAEGLIFQSYNSIIAKNIAIPVNMTK